MNTQTSAILVFGAGAFGSALASHALNSSLDVTLVTYLDSQLQELKQKNCPFKLMSQESWVGKLPNCQFILLAVPCQALSETCDWILQHGFLDESIFPPILSVAKGIELGTLRLPHQILEDKLPKNTTYGTLSGPSFATELLQGLPTSVVIATHTPQLAKIVQRALHHHAVRVYAGSDVVGVEVGGALKNVVAMAAGAVDGLGLGNNARASLITRGLNEMAQLGTRLGAAPLTFLGLSGLGDLVLTCTSPLSRNWKFGYGLALGKSRDMLEKDMGQVIEGVTTAKSAYQLSQKLGLDTPIFFAIYKVLYEDLPIAEAVTSLIGREYKKELNWLP